MEGKMEKDIIQVEEFLINLIDQFDVNDLKCFVYEIKNRYPGYFEELLDLLRQRVELLNDSIINGGALM